jgi:hypothetical protein
MQGRQLRPGLARAAREMSAIPAATQHSPSGSRARNSRARAAAAGCPRWLPLPARFVEHQQTRAAHQPLRHREHLLLPACERVAALVTLLGNLGKLRPRFLDPRGALAARQVVARQQEIVGDGNLREHAMSFDDMHKPGARGLARRWRWSCPPPKRTRPAFTGSNPDSARSMVVLPAPLPSSAWSRRQGSRP